MLSFCMAVWKEQHVNLADSSWLHDFQVIHYQHWTNLFKQIQNCQITSALLTFLNTTPHNMHCKSKNEETARPLCTPQISISQYILVLGSRIRSDLRNICTYSVSKNIADILLNNEISLWSAGGAWKDVHNVTQASMFMLFIDIDL